MLAITRHAAYAVIVLALILPSALATLTTTTATPATQTQRQPNFPGNPYGVYRPRDCVANSSYTCAETCSWRGDRRGIDPDAAWLRCTIYTDQVKWPRKATICEDYRECCAKSPSCSRITPGCMRLIICEFHFFAPMCSSTSVYQWLPTRTRTWTEFGEGVTTASIDRFGGGVVGTDGGNGGVSRSVVLSAGYRSFKTSTTASTTSTGRKSGPPEIGVAQETLLQGAQPLWNPNSRRQNVYAIYYDKCSRLPTSGAADSEAILSLLTRYQRFTTLKIPFLL